MATQILNGQTTWSMTRDEDSYRTYKITFRVQGDTTDGPANVLQTPGLPVYGTEWVVDDDVDLWAWCRWDADVRPVVEGEPNYQWLVTFTFSTKPPKCCRTVQVEDPLLEPMVISGGSNKYTEEATIDRHGKRILTSSLEQIRGPQNEWDANRVTIKIQQNVPDLQLNLCKSMVDCVNDATLWGVPKRGVKCSSFTFERKFYGTCNVYYSRTFEFEVNEKGWDRRLLDEGTKALNGRHDPNTGAWVLLDIDGSPPDPTNPLHFRRYKDRAGENTTVILDGHGKPFVPSSSSELDPDADSQWWCIPKSNSTVDGDYIITQSNCADATELAASCANAGILGPYLDEPGATSACQEAGAYEDSEDPNEFDCADGSKKPGSIPVEKYEEANFLLLGIPTSF